MGGAAEVKSKPGVLVVYTQLFHATLCWIMPTQVTFTPCLANF